MTVLSSCCSIRQGYSVLHYCTPKVSLPLCWSLIRKEKACDIKEDGILKGWNRHTKKYGLWISEVAGDYLVSLFISPLRKRGRWCGQGGPCCHSARMKSRPKLENMLYVLPLDVSLHGAASLKRIKYHILWVMKGHLWMLQPQRGHSRTLGDGRFTMDSVNRPATSTLLSQIPINCQLSSLPTPGDGMCNAYQCHADLIFKHILLFWVGQQGRAISQHCHKHKQVLTKWVTPPEVVLRGWKEKYQMPWVSVTGDRTQAGNQDRVSKAMVTDWEVRWMWGGGFQTKKIAPVKVLKKRSQGSSAKERRATVGEQSVEGWGGKEVRNPPPNMRCNTLQGLVPLSFEFIYNCLEVRCPTRAQGL